MRTTNVNINADLGEGAGQDAQLMPLLSSCNIACGGHIGDRTSMIEAIRLAKKHDVKIGAHPSYPDKENFGRVRPDVDDIVLMENLMNQLEQFFRIAEEEKVEVHHIKAHGALYNDAAADREVAELFLNTTTRLGLTKKIYTPFNSQLHQAASPSFSVCFEGFIDRAYNDDLSLVSRGHELALHKSKERAWKQLYEMYFLEEVTTISGRKIAIQADTFCIHGDHPNALNMLSYIREQLSKTEVK